MTKPIPSFPNLTENSVFLEKLQETKPQSQIQARGILVLRLILIALLVLLGIVAVALYIFEVFQNLNWLDVEILSLTSFELLLAAVLGSLLIFFIYRQTDWPLVTWNKNLILCSLLIIFIFGSSLAYASATNFLPTRPLLRHGLNSVHKLPLQKKKQLHLRGKMQEKNIFMGEIREVRKVNLPTGETVLFQVFNPKYGQTRDFYTRLKVDLWVGQPIFLRFRPTDMGLEAIEIKQPMTPILIIISPKNCQLDCFIKPEI